MRISRHGKLSLLHFGSRAVVVFQLGMSGRLVSRGPSRRHDHIALHLSGGCTVTCADHRRFGAVYVRPATELARHSPLDGIGPDALDPALDATLFPSGSRAIKEALLDQSIVAGWETFTHANVCTGRGLTRAAPAPN
jgi:formamidopyrimidine-DNA glycosylase